MAAYKRVLLKISGEALLGAQGYGINPEILTHVSAEIAETAVSMLVERIEWGAGSSRPARLHKAAFDVIVRESSGGTASGPAKATSRQPGATPQRLNG